MLDTITRYLTVFGDARERLNLRAIVNPIADRISTQALTNSTLVIKAGGSALAKTGAADSYFSVQGILVKIAASTDQAALSGSTLISTVNVYCFFVDSAGTGTSAMGTAGATLGAVKWPAMPVGKALVGFVIVAPTVGTFVGGTTALDENSTVVPATVYVSPDGAFDPSVIL